MGDREKINRLLLPDRQEVRKKAKREIPYCTVSNPSPKPPIHNNVSFSPSFSFSECAPACSNAISFSLYRCAVPACAISP